MNVLEQIFQLALVARHADRQLLGVTLQRMHDNTGQVGRLKLHFGRAANGSLDVCSQSRVVLVVQHGLVLDSQLETLVARSSARKHRSPYSIRSRSHIPRELATALTSEQSSRHRALVPRLYDSVDFRGADRKQVHRARTQHTESYRCRMWVMRCSSGRILASRISLHSGKSDQWCEARCSLVRIQRGLDFARLAVVKELGE